MKAHFIRWLMLCMIVAVLLDGPHDLNQIQVQALDVSMPGSNNEDQKRPFRGFNKKQLKAAKLWATAFKEMDESGSNAITYEEYWNWVLKHLKQAKYDDKNIIRVEEHWNEKFYQISK